VVVGQNVSILAYNHAGPEASLLEAALRSSMLEKAIEKILPEEFSERHVRGWRCRRLRAGLDPPYG
jgi:hypothetical protein